MRNILFTLFAITIGFSSNAQETESSLLKQANAEFAHLRYAYAIPLYKRQIQLNPSDTTATLQLAKCYQINNQYDSAIKYTQLAANKGANTGSMLPELLANKGDYAGAASAYANNSSPLAIVRKKGFSDINSFMAEAMNYDLKYLAINTPFNEYAVLTYRDGLIFESNRAQKIKSKNEFSWDGAAYSKLYFTNNKQTVSLDQVAKAEWKEKTFNVAIADLLEETNNDNNKILSKQFDFKTTTYSNSGVQLFDQALLSKYNVGAICISADSSTAYFTKNQQQPNKLFKSNVDDKHLLEIWSAGLVNGKLTNLVKLPFNKPNASYFHPAITKDNKRLYFISDAPGGQGGTDLYYVEKDAQGNWGAAVNAGDKINTVGNELYPTVSGDELYISSNGHAGLGGLDIYKVLFNNTLIAGVENIGSPINSSTDDMSFTKNGNEGYFVSNRFGSDDIFSFKYEIKKVKVSGRVIASDGSKPAMTVKLYSLNPVKLLETVTADATGAYSFLILSGIEYSIEAADGVGNIGSLTTNTKGSVLDGNTYKKTLADLVVKIAPIQKEESQKVASNKITFNNLIDSLKALTNDYVQYHHNFDKTSLVKKDIKPFNDLLMRVKAKKNAKIVVVSAADCMGSPEYNEKLSSRRADAMSAQISKLNKKVKVVSLHLGDRVLVEPCALSDYNEEKQAENRYTYVFIVKD